MIKNKLVPIVVFSLTLLMVTVSCEKKVGKSPSTGGSTNKCDTVVYNKHVKPIIDTKCAMAGCHPANADFIGYSNASQLASRIKIRAVDQGTMPPSNATVTPLSDEQKQIITCWIENGKKEN